MLAAEQMPGEKTWRKGNAASMRFRTFKGVAREFERRQQAAPGASRELVIQCMEAERTLLGMTLYDYRRKLQKRR